MIVGSGPLGALVRGRLGLWLIVGAAYDVSKTTATVSKCLASQFMDIC